MSCWDGFGPPERDEDGEYADSEDADESWRGDVHLDDWPEDLAGPEYRLWKDEQDKEEG